MNKGVVLFLIMILLMKIIMISTGVIFKSAEDKLKINQEPEVNHINEVNLYKKYKRNLEFLTRKSVKNQLIFQNKFEVKKISIEDSKICNRKNCKIPYGECIDDKICKCLEPYANLELLIESVDIKNNYTPNKFHNTKKDLNYSCNNYFYENNMNNVNNYNVFCQYKRKSQLIAFALEAIFMAGIGHIYLNRLLHGLIKFTLFFILGSMYCFIKRKNTDVRFFSINSEQNKTLEISLLNVSMVLLFACLLALQVYDMIMFGTNSFPDGFGVPLMSWNKGVGILLLFDFKNHSYLVI